MYTTLYYTPEAGTVLDELDGPEYKCNHERGAHSKRAGGRDPTTGVFVSAAAAAYRHQLCAILARAFTVARTGAETMNDAVRGRGDAANGSRGSQLRREIVEPPAAAGDDAVSSGPIAVATINLACTLP